MITWDEALDLIDAGQTNGLHLRRSRMPPFTRTPVAITGSAGAGKTRLWSRLTKLRRPDQSSRTTDDGYLIQPKKGAITLTTIPGQQSRNRYMAIEELFGSKTILRGVIFLSCHGFDHIWQRNADLVANDLRAFNLNRLRDRNRREELESFKEICAQIQQKRWLAPEEYRPKWLLVLVNKIDLYWNTIDGARQYYRPGSGSKFDQIAADLHKQLGTSDFRYAVLPVSTESQGYSFRSFRGTLSVPTQLSASQCTASVTCIVDALEELCDV